MRSIQSYIDEGFEVFVYKESEVKPEPRGKKVKHNVVMHGKEVELVLDDTDIALGKCDYCNEGPDMQINALLAFCCSDNHRHLAFVHDRCYVSAMAEWGLKEEA